MRKIAVVLALSVLLLCLLPLHFVQVEVKAPDGYPVHNINTGFSYTTIQEAIDAPQTSNGHKILVKEGIYFENVVIDKSLSLIGENKDVAIIDGKGIGDVVTIEANNVSISSFAIRSSGGDYLNSGIRVCGDNTTISDNNIVNCHNGIQLFASNNNKILANNLTNHQFGISFATVIEGTTAIGSSGNIIQDNNAMSNLVTAIYVSANSKDNVINRNNIMNNYQGITFGMAFNNTIAENVITNNEEFGVELNYASGNTLRSNIISNNNLRGLYLVESFDNTIIGNKITGNTYGILSFESFDNLVFHNNFINNTSHAATYIVFPNGKANIWNSSIEGNYWDSYSGNDVNLDGVGDAPYNISENNTDHFPLMGMFHSFNTSLARHVDVICNSTVNVFEYTDSTNTINMLVSNSSTNQTFGFVRICISHALINETYYVTVNGSAPYYVDYNIYDNGTHRWVYFTYEHSTLKIAIVPEFLSPIILLLFMMATLLAALVYRRRKFK